MNKKITSSALAAIMIAGTTSFSAFAAMPNGTVVIGTKAFDLGYANNAANMADITNAIVAGGTVFVKNFEGKWINNATGLVVEASTIPAVTYKNAAGVVSAFDAMDKDAVTTLAVASVSAITNTRLNVALTTAVTATPDASKFVIKDASGNVVTVSAVALSADAKTVKLTTAAQTTNTIYTMTVAGADYKFVAMPADITAPKLSSAVATSNTKLTLAFDSKVDENALNIANYSIAGLSVLKAEYELDADSKPIKTSVILTTASQTVGTIYKVAVTNVVDLAGNVINADYDEFQFGGLPVDAVKPHLNSTVALTNTTVKVTFDEIMDKAKAENIANYSIAGLTVLKAELATNKVDVTLTTVGQTVGAIYKVVVTNVADITGNVIDADYDEFQFGGLAVDTVKPHLNSAVALTNTTVKATFDKTVDITTAENAANYTIAGLTVTKAVLSDDKLYVTLTTSAQTLGTIYKTVVTNVKDLSGNVIDADYDEFQFGGLSADTTKPKVSGVIATSNTSVKVTFNEPISDATGVLAYNYYFGTELGYATAAVKDITVTDGTVWVLTTATQAGKVYTLDVTGAIDLSGNVLDEDYDTATFAGNSALDVTAPKVASSVATDKNTVVVKFNEAMDPTTIQAADFVFSVSSGTETAKTLPATVLAGMTADAISVADDDMTVTLQFTNAVQTAGVVYKATVANVKDAAQNTVNATYNYSLFAGSSLVNAAPKVSTAILLDNQTLKINFSEPISIVSATSNAVTNLLTGDFAIVPGAGSSAFTGAFEKATLSSDNKSLTVYYKDNTAIATDKFAAGKLYTVTVNAAKVKDELALNNLSTAVATDNQGVFAGVTSSITTPKIASIVAVDKNTIDITFNQKITSTLSKANLGDLTVTNNATGASFSAVDALIRAEGTDGNKVRVFFDNSTPFVAGTVYKVTIANAKIVNENATVMAAVDNNAVFAAVSTTNAKPSIAAVTVVNANTIKVVMSEKVTLAADGTVDFVIGSQTITAPSLSVTDGKTITLTLSAPLTPSSINTITVAPGANIMDEAGVDIINFTSTLDFAN